MQALVFEGPGRMVVAERPVPEPAPGEVRIRIAAAGVCGSELGSYTGHSKRRPPGLVFGHELAGWIDVPDAAVACGGEVLAPGTPVTMNPLISCGRCDACLEGRANACPYRSLLGMHVPGGFAEYVAVPTQQVQPLPNGLDLIAGSLTEPIANAVHVAHLCGDLVGRSVAIFGAGAIGLSVLAVLRLAGVARVAVVDPVAPRRQQAEQEGADPVLDPGAGDPVAALGALNSGRGPDAVVDAAGLDLTRAQSIEACCNGGTVVLLGLHDAESRLPVNLAILKELRLQASYAYTPTEFDAWLALLAAGRIHYQPWITEMPLSQGDEAFRILTEEPWKATKIVLRPPMAPGPGPTPR
jgi:threonine dehydrogenase-like Zn-dependent dehydrogenase